LSRSDRYRPGAATGNSPFLELARDETNTGQERHRPDGMGVTMEDGTPVLESGAQGSRSEPSVTRRACGTRVALVTQTPGDMVGHH
jgi:hypothetical protein